MLERGDEWRTVARQRERAIENNACNCMRNPEPARVVSLRATPTERAGHEMGDGMPGLADDVY